jgi:GntR family transcriptional repressor for pyruvate dehydrogenase complex
MRVVEMRPSATRRVVNALLATLRSGRYRVGDRLPSESELAADLSVGRSAVREATRELSAMGLVASRQGSGVYVQSLRADRLLTSSSFAEGERVATKAELLEVRLIMEPGVAAIAAERATEEEIARLRHDLDRLIEAVAAGYRPPEDVGFHLDIVRAAHNASLVRVAAAIVSFYDAEENLPTERDVEEHQRIFLAIARRDPTGAARAMHDHLRTEQSKLESVGAFARNGEPPQWSQ